jgi:hypothetical protein
VLAPYIKHDEIARISVEVQCFIYFTFLLILLYYVCIEINIEKPFTKKKNMHRKPKSLQFTCFLKYVTVETYIVRQPW